MSTQRMDGKLISTKVRARVKEGCEALKARGVTPGLAVVLVGEDAASKVYVANKKKACEEVGFYSEQHDLIAETTQEQLMALIEDLNAREEISGILVQLPLPRHLDEKAVLSAIDPTKDVDCFHPENVGHLMIGDSTFLPCTPAGVMEMLAAYDIDVAGKSCVIIGRSNIVGKPMSMLLLHKHGTVTVCHSKTKDLPAVCREADILVAAIGKAKFVDASYVKPGAVVIDVGINRDENGKLCGDVDAAALEGIASYLTPVPGGVGPMTITMLMQNTLRAAEQKAALK